MPDTGAMSHVDTEGSSPTLDHAQGHDAGHGTSHGHGHEATSEPLGPVDLAAWAFAGAGALIGLVTVLALYLAAAS